MPSVAAVTDAGRLLVGHNAKAQAATNPEGTVYSTKRLIGRKWNELAAAAALETCAYTLIEGPQFDDRVVLRDTRYSIPEVAAMVFRKVKANAEQHLGHEVDTA